MPTRLDLEAAVPLCPRTRYAPRPAGPGHPPTRVACYSPMRYRAGSNTWYCTRCSGETKAGEIVARQRATTLREAA